jgi:hypothetical protein
MRKIGGIAVVLVACAGVSAAATVTRTTVRTQKASVSSSQLFQRLDSIDAKLKELQKAVDAAAAKAPVAVSAPVGTPIGAGVAEEARNLSQAFYNAGIAQRKAANMRLAARLIRDLTVAGGTILAFAGWESAHDKLAPRTLSNGITEYPAFTAGVATAVLGVVMSEIVEMMANRADAAAAKALMSPLEAAPEAK